MATLVRFELTFSHRECDVLGRLDERVKTLKVLGEKELLFKRNGAANGARTRDLRRDRPIF